MCNFFTCIVTTSGDVLFTEEDSHDAIITRAGFADNLKHFIRLEYTSGRGYEIDECTIPEWYERIAAKARINVKATYLKVLAAHSAMMKIRNKAFEEYQYKRRGSRIEERGVITFNAHECYSENSLKYRRILFNAIQDYKDKIENIKGYVGPISPIGISSFRYCVPTP